MPPGALKESELGTDAMFYLRTCIGGDVKLPQGYILASPLYLVEVDENITFEKDLEVSIAHCVVNDTDVQSLCLVTGEITPADEDNYTLIIEKIPLNHSIPGVVSFSTRHFCPMGAVIPERGNCMQ